MQIVLNKHPNKSPTLSCLRDDGSVTWQNYGNQGEFFPIHDLTHFVVETELGYRNAFFGMVAQGRDLNDFDPGDAATFHPEAMHAEMLAGLLTVAEGRGSRLSYQGIKETIDNKAQELGIPAIALTEEQLIRIRQRSQELAATWKSLPAGDKLILAFELSV